MNAIVSLCHFCELHGPSVLFCTQAFHPNDPQTSLDTPVDSESWLMRTRNQRASSVNSNASGADGALSAPATPTGTKSTDFCEACRGAAIGQQGFISTDSESGISYLSSLHPHHPKVFSMVRHACVRSLSCEVCPRREGPIFFGDDHSGHVFSHTFVVKDVQARGSQRSYSIIVVMMDKIYLLNSWPFLVSSICNIIDDIQTEANKVYEEEYTQCPPQRRRFASNSSSSTFRQMRGPIKPARSIIELTNNKQIFNKLHQSFTWILNAGGNRLKEKLLEGPPTEDSNVDLEKQEDTEDGFVMVCANTVSVNSEDEIDVESKEHLESDPEQEAVVATFTSLRSVIKVLGETNFHLLAHHVIIGNQIIIRSQHKKVVHSMIDMLKTLLPKGCCKVIPWSKSYVDSWRCNFLGLKPGVSIPAHVELFVCVDIVTPEESSVQCGIPSFTGYSFLFESPLQLCSKAPAVLQKMEQALLNEGLADSVVDQCLVCLKEEWMNKVKVRFMFTKAGGPSTDSDIRKLLPVIGAQREDIPVLQFWMTGLSAHYKHHMLSSAKERKL